MLSCVSYKTLKYESAERPPFKIVPGQREGEKRNAKSAQVKQLIPSPAMRGVRSADGRPARTAATEEATDSAVKPIASGVVEGDAARSPELSSVNIDMITPAAMVKLISFVDDTIEEETVYDQDRPVSGVVGVTALAGCEEKADMPAEGRGGGMKKMEHANAKYPSNMSEGAALKVTPLRSNNRPRRRTAIDAFRILRICCQSIQVGLCSMSVLVNPEATVINSAMPVRMPPICVEA